MADAGINHLAVTGGVQLAAFEHVGRFQHHGDFPVLKQGADFLSGERLFQREPVRKWSEALRRIGLRKLLMLDAATRLDDLRVPPANRLEKLAGRRAGQYSIRVNDQWRVCFRWSEGDAYDVEIVDYH